MSDAIIVALITGGITFAGTALTNLFTHSKTIYRIEQLEKKQDRHNNFMERLMVAEGSIRVLEEKTKDLDQDVSELKHRTVS